MVAVSLGIGITGNCNLRCKHCYSSNERGQNIELKYLKKLVESCDIESINLGTGESYLHPEFSQILSFFKDSCIRLGLTSNGFTVLNMTDEQISWFNDIDFSIDFPDSDNHDLYRGSGTFNNVLNGIRRCKEIGVPCSIATCLSKANFLFIRRMISLAENLDVNLRINIYKGNDNEFKLDYDEFWFGIKELINNCTILSCSEPILLPLLGVKKRKKLEIYSARIKPNGEIVPCVYWPATKIHIDHISEQYNPFLTLMRNSEEFKLRHLIPEECNGCEFVSICKGGCACRRVLTNIRQKDEYCWVGKERIYFNYKWGQTKNLVHADYLCTIIVRGK